MTPDNEDARTIKAVATIQVTGATLDGITYVSLVKFLLKLSAALLPVWVIWVVTGFLLSTWFAGLQRLVGDLRAR